MQNDQISLIKQLIQTRLDNLTLEEQANQSSKKIVELDQQSVGRLSRMDSLQQQAMAKAVALRRQSEKKTLQDALSRLNCDEYGVCIDCGDQIAFERLKLKPSVLKCLDCANI